MKSWIKFFIFGVLALFLVVFVHYQSAQASDYSCPSVKASHILVDTQAQALALKTRIDRGESFEALAKKYSKCPSGQNGGDLGYFERGQMVKEFEDAAFMLPIGQVSDPVHTQFGWHLIKVYDRK
jgi:peptidyl-prolyl cis-trans isomerase C